MTSAGWKLEECARNALLARFPPRYVRTAADHVTLRFGTDDSTPLPAATVGEVIGEADDSDGVEALVVRIAGTSERGDGSHFHITWSLADERSAKEGNDVIKARGWRWVRPAMPIRPTPARWVG